MMKNFLLYIYEIFVTMNNINVMHCIHTRIDTTLESFVGLITVRNLEFLYVSELFQRLGIEIVVSTVFFSFVFVSLVITFSSRRFTNLQ